jgi:N-acetylneuraminic acid mutarotase
MRFDEQTMQTSQSQAVDLPSLASLPQDVLVIIGNALANPLVPTPLDGISSACRSLRAALAEVLVAHRAAHCDRAALCGTDLLYTGGNELDYTRTGERYDPVTNVWTDTTVATSTDHESAAVLNADLYALSRDRVHTGYVWRGPTVMRHDPATNAMQELPVIGIARFGASMAVLDAKLYLVGGADVDTGESMRSVERYDPVTNAWEAVANMRSKRAALGVAVLDGKLYAAGGINDMYIGVYPVEDDDLHMTSVERYDPATNAWEAIAPMSTKRSHHGAAALGGKLYVAGGFNDVAQLSSAEQYDPATNTWTAVPAMSTERDGNRMAVLDGKLYAVGGQSGGHPLRSVERYDPETNAWEAMAPMGHPRAYGSVVAVNASVVR